MSIEQDSKVTLIRYEGVLQFANIIAYMVSDILKPFKHIHFEQKPRSFKKMGEVVRKDLVKL